MTTPAKGGQKTPAYSYIRFSHDYQSDGDSVRRQTTDSEDWCQRSGAELDETITLRDLGKSAFKQGKRRASKEDEEMAEFIAPEDLVNEDRRALAGFLWLIKQRRIRRGAYLIIENLDRLSRDQIVPATNLLTSILLAGVKVVQLRPVEQILTDIRLVFRTYQQAGKHSWSVCECD
jgi:hypothetical protein